MKKQSLDTTLGTLQDISARKNNGKNSKFVARKKRAQKLNKIKERIFETVYYFALICGAVTAANLIVNLILS